MVSVRALPQNKKAIQEIAKMDKVFHLMRPASDFVGGGPIVKTDQDELTKVKVMLNKAVDENVMLYAKVDELMGRLEKCAAATDDQKAVYWRNRALVAEKAANKEMNDGSY